MPGPTYGFVKLLASSGSHCTKWADEQHWQAGFESRLVPDLPLPFIPTLIGLRAFDLVSSRVWWEAATNTTNTTNLFVSHTDTLDRIWFISLTSDQLHHQEGVLTAWIPLSLFRHSSLSAIVLSKSSRRHPESMYWISMSLMSSSLLHQQCSSGLARLSWIVWEMSAKWPYNCYFVGCCFQGLFKTADRILL